MTLTTSAVPKIRRNILMILWIKRDLCMVKRVARRTDEYVTCDKNHSIGRKSLRALCDDQMVIVLISTAKTRQGEAKSSP